MDLIGLCSICGRPGAMYTCMFCGKVVCVSCFDKKLNMCINCRLGKQF